MAGLLFRNGADYFQEAEESSINRSLFDPTVTGRGYPLTRAVTLNRPFLVKVLLNLVSRYGAAGYHGGISLRARKLWRSTLCKLLAWGCHLQNYLVLEELSKSLEAALGPQVPTVTLSIRNPSFSPPALTISGCVSDNLVYRYDFPERFWRYMYHGKTIRSASLKQSASNFALVPIFMTWLVVKNVILCSMLSRREELMQYTC